MQGNGLKGGFFVVASTRSNLHSVDLVNNVYRRSNVSLDDQGN